MTKPRGLGRGLEQLIPTGGSLFPPAGDEQAVKEVPVELVEANPLQPRSSVDPAALRELADSILQYGVLQPLVVEAHEGRFRLVAGERRLRAARLAGLERVPVVVRPVGPDRERLELALVENLQRNDLAVLDEARAFNRLCDEFGLTQEQVAQRVGRSRPAVANTIRLLQAVPEVQAALDSQRISSAHARTLLAIGDPLLQARALEQILSRDLSVRETERLVSRLINRPSPVQKPGPTPVSAELSALADAIARRLATRVTIQPRPRGRGRIVIDYFSSEELAGLCDRLGVHL